MVADATGANLYLAPAGNLIHFVRTLPAPSGGDGAAPLPEHDRPRITRGSLAPQRRHFQPYNPG